MPWPAEYLNGQVLDADGLNAVIRALSTHQGDVNAGGFDINNVGTLRCDAIEFEGGLPVFESRQIIAGAGLTGGGDLSQDVTLAVGDLSGTYAVVGHNHDAAYVPVARTISAGAGLGGGGDLSADRTLSVTADSTTQRVEVYKGGSLVATRKAINLIEGSNVTLTVADDAGNNRVNVTVTASGGGAGLWSEGSGFIYPTTPANRVLAGTSTDDGATPVKLGRSAIAYDMQSSPGLYSGLVVRGAFEGNLPNMMELRRSRGTIASPTPLLAGEWIGIWGFMGYNASGGLTHSQNAHVSCVTTEDYIGSSLGGSAFFFATTPNGGSGWAERVRINHDGALIHTTVPTAADDAALVNGALRWHLASNTQLVFRVRGSDGGRPRGNGHSVLGG